MKGKAARAAQYVVDMIDACARILDYTSGMDEAAFLADRKTQDAVIRNIEILGEAAYNVLNTAPDVAAAHGEIQWAGIYGMRNRVSHGYSAVDLFAVWRVANREVASLKSELDALLRAIEGPQ
jgi:uncharacterized protein with HEPN domain